MVTIHPPVLAPAGEDDHSLRDWVEQLEATLFTLGWDQPPIVAGIVDGAVDLCLPPERHDDPLDDLIGFRAPDEWWAMGVITSGRVNELREEGGRCYGVRTEPARRARIGQFVDRRGTIVSFMRLGEEPPRVRDEPGVGRIDDLCRRALELPTLRRRPRSTCSGRPVG